MNHTCVCVFHCPRRPEDSIRSPGVRVTVVEHFLLWVLGTEVGPRREQYELLTTLWFHHRLIFLHTGRLLLCWRSVFRLCFFSKVLSPKGRLKNTCTQWGSFCHGLLDKLIGPASAASSDHSVKWPLGLVRCACCVLGLVFLYSQGVLLHLSLLYSRSSLTD